MDELYEKLEAWVEKQKYTFVMGEWFKGKSTKAITTDKLAELVPPTIKDAYPPKDIREQLTQVSITLDADDGEDEVEDFDPEAYTEHGVRNTLFSAGSKSIPITLRGYANMPNLNDFKYTKSMISYAYDDQSKIVMFLTTKTGESLKYTRIANTEDKLDISSALLASKTYERIQGGFENRLLEWEREIVKCWNKNLNLSNENAETYILANLPIALISSGKMSIICNEIEKPDQTMAFVATGVKFESGPNERLTFEDLIRFEFDKYRTFPFTQLDKMPKIYGNKGDTAMSIVDIEQYKVDEIPELSDSWKEVKCKFTEDEWAVYSTWHWARMDARNNGRQALAVIDYSGYGGKSAVTDVFIRHMGLDNACALGKGALGNQFWAGKFYNKRFVVFDDNKNSHLIQTEAMHTTLGGGYADVEFKGEQSFSWKMSSRVMINSNIDLNINSSLLHERTRVIVLKPKMPDWLVDKISAKDEFGNPISDHRGNRKLQGDPNFSDDLLNTIDTFFIQAWHHYKKLCPTGSDIVLPDSVLEHVYENESTEETMFNSIFKDAFEHTKDPSDKMSQAEFMKAYYTITKNDETYKQYANDNQYGNFKQFLKKELGIESKGRDRQYAGLRANIYNGPDPLNPQSQFKQVDRKKGFGRG